MTGSDLESTAPAAGSIAAAIAEPLHPPPTPSPRGHGAAFWMVAFVAYTVAGTLRFFYVYLDDIARARAGTLPQRLIEESTGAYTALLLFVGIAALESRWPITRAAWRRTLPIHLAGLVIYSVIHTSLMAATRDVIFPLAGLGDYDYGILSVRYLMEFPNDAIFYAAILTLLVALRTWHTLRDRELRASELERALAQAQLRNLELRLQPHFLFNALNTISARMYEDPAAADAMMGQLAELLRQSLRAPHTQEVPLGDEVALLDNYIAIMRARFGDALCFAVDVERDAEPAAVPALLLQPLVENAVRHGPGARGGPGRIDVRARRVGRDVVLEVTDDGPGAATPSALVNGGVGLATTRERLGLLYGENHGFSAGNRPDGGFAVRIRLPFRAADTDQDVGGSVGARGVAAGTPLANSARS
jgi:two-component system, LytTR family, sensor kinase